MTALLFTIDPALEPSTKLSSVAFDVTFVPPISKVVICTSPATVRIAEPKVNKSVSPAPPIVPPLLITRSSEIVSNPAELKLIFSAAASLAAVLKLNFVALLDELKSPSETASIPAATNIASVPVPSSGA